MQAKLLGGDKFLSEENFQPKITYLKCKTNFPTLSGNRRRRTTPQNQAKWIARL
jgi:hypothetical protein